MDDMTKKIFVRLDASMPGERVNAVDLFYDHLQKIGQTCRDILHEFEQAIPAQRYADLEKLYNNAAQENAQWAQRYQQQERALASATRQLTLYKQAVWLKLNWHTLAAMAVVLAGAWLGYGWLTRPAWPDNADTYLRHIVRDAASLKFDHPFVVSVGNQSYWLLARGETDTSSYVDSTNHAVVMQCVHLFVGPVAEATGAQYYKPHPYSLFGYGWLQWPERYADCQKSPNQIVGQR
jgi:hypothetical protein